MNSSTCDWVGNQNFVVINVQAHFLLPATESKAHDRNAAREYNCRKLVGTSPLLGISPDSTCTPWNLVGAFQLWRMLKFTSAPHGTSRTQGAGTKPNLRLAVLGKKSRQKRLLQLPFAFCLASVQEALLEHVSRTSTGKALVPKCLIWAATTCLSHERLLLEYRMLSEQSTFPTDIVSRSYCKAKCGSVLAKPISQLTQTRKDSESSEVFFRTVIEYVWLKDQIKIR